MQDLEGIYKKEWEVNFTQCYANGKIKFSEISNIFQLAASEHAMALGFGFFEMLKYNQTWVMSKVRMEIIKLPKWTEHIEINTWVQYFETDRSIRNFTLTVNGEVYVNATTYWVVINTQLRKSEALALPTDKVHILTEKNATEQSFSKLNILQETTPIASHEIRLSDLDIVNHANNVKYVDWCLDYIDKDLILQERISCLEMNYLRELRYADTAEIGQLKMDDKIFMNIRKSGKISFAMELTVRAPK